MAIPYLLSVLTGITLAGLALKMLRFPTVTQQPSFINCFSYLSPAKTTILLVAALVIAGAMILLSALQRATTLVFIEAAMIWTTAYLALVGLSSAPHATDAVGVWQNLALLWIGALTWFFVLRWSLRSAAA